MGWYRRLCQFGYLNSGSKRASFYGFSTFSSVSQRIGTWDIKVNKKFHNLFLAGPGRFYCVNADFVPSGVKGIFKRYFESWQTVPYTKRTRRVLLTIPQEIKNVMEINDEEQMADFKDKILPPTHQDSVRVRMIAKDIIDALQIGVKKMEYVSKHTMIQHMWMGREGWLQPTTSHLDGLNLEVLVVNEPYINAGVIVIAGTTRIYV